MPPIHVGHFHQVHHHAGNPSGTYEDDSPAYWQELTDALSPAGAILLLGHGKGKANATHHWVAYVEKHRKDVAAKVVADVRVDIDHLEKAQVLGLAQYYFAGAIRLSLPEGSRPMNTDGREFARFLEQSRIDLGAPGSVLMAGLTCRIQGINRAPHTRSA